MFLVLKACIIIALFASMAFLMYLRLLPVLLALPLLAVTIPLCAGVPVASILVDVVSAGPLRLSLAMITVFFGAMLGQLIKNSGIARSVIRNAAEYSGDNPFWISLVLLVVTALLFTVLGGLGAVIMVATIVLPVLLSIGVPPVTAASIFLIGMSMGGILNLANWQLYMTVLGLDQTRIFAFAIPLFVVMMIVAVIFLAVELRRGNLSYLCSADAPAENEAPPLLSLFTPLVPLVLVLGFALYNVLMKPALPFNFPIVGAMFSGLVYGFATTWRGWKRSINLITKSVIDGVSSSAPAAALIMGIGMLLCAVTHPTVSAVMRPIISAVLPEGRIGYVVLFSLLAPLSLYRGPLNIWGLGSGLIGVMMTAGKLSSPAIMAAMMSVGQMQGVADPTNTFNVWIANHLNINVHDILKKTIAYMWVLAALGLVIASMRYF